MIEYLGRSTHEVAISNHRIQHIGENEMGFSYKDYRDGSKTKTMTLSNLEFTRRLTQHILHKRFVRIRHYGILSSNWKRGKLQGLQTELKVAIIKSIPKTMFRKCPCCKTGTQITIETFAKRGPPSSDLSAIKTFSCILRICVGDFTRLSERKANKIVGN